MNVDDRTKSDSIIKIGVIEWATGLPVSILAGQTTRVAPSRLQSQHPFEQFNLALHVGDAPNIVQAQRIELLKLLQPYGAKRLVWLEQTHSTQVYTVTEHTSFLPVNADAVITQHAGVACMIMTADCLPIILTDATGREVACIHAGWRGLLNGIIENTIAKMQCLPVYAWFGAAIGAASFEVGQEVYDLFVAHDVIARNAFSGLDNGKYLADIYLLAKQRLVKLGITAISGGMHCSYQQQDLYYSYRRQAKTGRMASFVMLCPH